MLQTPADVTLFLQLHGFGKVKNICGGLQGCEKGEGENLKKGLESFLLFFCFFLETMYVDKYIYNLEYLVGVRNFDTI